MKLGEPKKIAFESDNDWAMDFWDAQENRSNEFWTELECAFDVVGVKDNKPFSETDHCSVCTKIVHDKIKECTLQPLIRLSKAIADEKHFDLPCDIAHREFWQTVKFILAFNTSFDYFTEDEDGNMTDEQETDYLDDETTFRYDVVNACDRLALEGAAFSKRIGSDTYSLWADAMIKLGDKSEKVQFKAADDIVAALARTWADLRTWIFMKSAHKAKKAKPKSKKTKR